MRKFLLCALAVVTVLLFGVTFNAAAEEGVTDTEIPVSYTHLTLPTTCNLCRSRWSPYH
mgnify:CR=1 FL=1